MNPLNIVHTILDIAYYLANWRFGVCLFASIALAVVVTGAISAEPLRWIVDGIIIVAGMIVGHRWNSGC